MNACARETFGLVSIIIVLISEVDFAVKVRRMNVCDFDAIPMCLPLETNMNASLVSHFSHHYKDFPKGSQQPTFLNKRGNQRLDESLKSDDTFHTFKK